MRLNDVRDGAKNVPMGPNAQKCKGEKQLVWTHAWPNSQAAKDNPRATGFIRSSLIPSILMAHLKLIFLKIQTVQTGLM